MHKTGAAVARSPYNSVVACAPKPMAGMNEERTEAAAVAVSWLAGNVPEG